MYSLYIYISIYIYIYIYIIFLNPLMMCNMQQTQIDKVQKINASLMQHDMKRQTDLKMN